MLPTGPEAHLGFEHIPIIDLLDLSSSEQQTRNALAAKIREACTNVGVFYVSNHGITDEIVQGVFGVAQEYFSGPLESKVMYVGCPRASIDIAKHSEVLQFFQESLSIGSQYLDENDLGMAANADSWHPEVPDFRIKVTNFYRAAIAFGRSLFPFFALALGLPETFFDNDKGFQTAHSAAAMCLLHYPFHKDPQHEIGAEAHTDCQLFTMLWQQPGIQALEVQNSTKQWIQVPPIPGMFIIIVGNFFARRTNDIFKPCIHRVTNPNGRERHSFSVSFGTESSLKLEPIPGCTSPERRYRYEILTAGECSEKITFPDSPTPPVGH